MVGKELRVRLDKGDDVVEFLLGRMETALAACGDNELVAAHPPPVVVKADVGGIAQAVTPVQVIARVKQHVLPLLGLRAFVVEAVTAALQFAGVELRSSSFSLGIARKRAFGSALARASVHPPVPTLGNKRRGGEEEPSANPAQMMRIGQNGC